MDTDTDGVIEIVGVGGGVIVVEIVGEPLIEFDSEELFDGDTLRVRETDRVSVIVCVLEAECEVDGVNEMEPDTVCASESVNDRENEKVGVGGGVIVTDVVGDFENEIDSLGDTEWVDVPLLLNEIVREMVSGNETEIEGENDNVGVGGGVMVRDVEGEMLRDTDSERERLDDTLVVRLRLEEAV